MTFSQLIECCGRYIECAAFTPEPPENCQFQRVRLFTAGEINSPCLSQTLLLGTIEDFLPYRDRLAGAMIVVAGGENEAFSSACGARALIWLRDQVPLAEVFNTLMDAGHFQETTGALSRSDGGLGAFLAEIFQGRRISKKELSTQLAAANWKLDHYYILVKCVYGKSIPAGALSFQELGAVIENSFSAVRTFVSDDGLYCIVNRNLNDMIRTRHIREVLTPIGRKNGFIFGSSNGIIGLDKLVHYRRQPDLAIKYGLLFHPEKNFYQYSNYMVFHLIDSCNQFTNLEAFIHPSVKLLWELDQKNGTEYVKTLMAYVNSDRMVSKASEELFIHRNTFNYRFEKIKDITCIEFNNEETILQIILSCHIVEYLDKYRES